jgi:hypothetical protein
MIASPPTSQNWKKSPCTMAHLLFLFWRVKIRKMFFSVNSKTLAKKNGKNRQPFETTKLKTPLHAAALLADNAFVDVSVSHP